MPKSMAQVHEEGGHDEYPRKSCPDCEDRFTGTSCPVAMTTGERYLPCGSPVFRTESGGLRCTRSHIIQ